MNSDDEMAPITRKELREELAPIKAELAQLGPIKAELAQLGPIKAELVQHRFELDGLHKMMAYVIDVMESGFREMREGFKSIEQRFEQRFQTFRVEFRAELNADMASQARSMTEEFRTWFGTQDDKILAVDEKYADLPGRVAALEDPTR
ncbi:MAG TPA: hypothetical protein VGM90_33490 [Kofleriaceae bacterium]